MAKRIFAMFDRDEECEHGLGFPYTGRIPCTGPRKCPLCGLTPEEAMKEPWFAEQVRLSKEIVDEIIKEERDAG